MTKTTSFLAAVALLLVSGGELAAQTDFGFVFGAGAGTGASVSPRGVPPGNRGRANLGAVNTSGYANAAANFRNATGAVSVTNPRGGQMSLPQGEAQALGQVLGGNSAGAATLITALGGGNNAQALVNALLALGANSSSAAALNDAVDAYNALIDGLPANGAPSAAALAVRQALFAAMAKP